MRQYTQSNIAVADLYQHKDNITLLNGIASKGSFPQDVNFYIAEQTSLNITESPGGHLGYVQKPADFADVLREMWS